MTIKMNSCFKIKSSLIKKIFRTDYDKIFHIPLLLLFTLIFYTKTRADVKWEYMPCPGKIYAETG
jgi:hypothetical protein